MSSNSPLGGSRRRARATSAASMESSPDCGVDRRDLRRETIDHWSAALARGDDAEVDRLVRQSRIDRVWVAASGQLGPMLGHAGPSTPSEIAERALPPETDDLEQTRNKAIAVGHDIRPTHHPTSMTGSAPPW